MLKKQTSWRKYEEHTSSILNDEVVKKYLEKHLSLKDFKIQPKEKLPGKSGTNWQVDAYGDDINEQRILVECKHYKGKRYKKDAALEQNIIAAFAYIIKDVGASRGIVVTTQGLQEGASKVAKYEGIELLQLDYNSTDKNFVIRFPENNQAVAVFTDECGSISAAKQYSSYTKHPLG
jgi:hypothetical protein